MISCDNPSHSKVNLEDEKAAIQMVINEHLDAVDSLDVTRLLNCMTEDHLGMPANMPDSLANKLMVNTPPHGWVSLKV